MTFCPIIPAVKKILGLVRHQTNTKIASSILKKANITYHFKDVFDVFKYDGSFFMKALLGIFEAE